MGRSTTSLRLDDELRAQLSQRAEIEGVSVTALVERVLSEGLAMAQHPGIVFRPGYTGRRAALVAGPDVWTIASSLRHTSGTEKERVSQLVEEFGLHERHILTALDYIAAHRDQIEAEVRANDIASEELERLAEARQRLLA
jgi:hypothetical protein